MGHESTVYGAIELHKSKDAPDRYLTAAAKAISSLPKNRDEDEWPFLNQEHFSTGAGYYKSSILLFGGSFKDIEYEWDQWLSKFESFIALLCWRECHLHLCTEISCNFDYNYSAESIYVGSPGVGHWLPPLRWRFIGGPRCSRADELWFCDSQITNVWHRIDGHWSLSTDP